MEPPPSRAAGSSTLLTTILPPLTWAEAIYSPKVDSSALVGEYWLAAAKFRIDIHADRVASKSNLANAQVDSAGVRWSSLELYNARRVHTELLDPQVSLAFSLYGLSAARPLVQSQSDPLTALGREEKSHSTT